MARLRNKRLAMLVDQDGTRHALEVERHPAQTYGRGAFMIIFTEHYDALMDKIDNGSTIKVLNRLFRLLTFTEYRPVNQNKLAERARISQASVSAALKELSALGAIEREGKGPTTRWRLTTDWAWEGGVDKFHAFRAGRLKGKKPPTATGQNRIIHIMSTPDPPA